MNIYKIMRTAMLSLGVVSSSFANPYVLQTDGQSAYKHLEALQQIALENDGHRAAGSSGHIMSANYIAQKLLNVGYKVELVPFKFTQFKQLTPASLKITEGAMTQELEDKKEFNVMSFSPSGNLNNLNIEAVDLQLGIGNDSTSGCEAEDFSETVQGKIALIQRGACSFAQKAHNAQRAGAAAVMIFNQGNEETRKELFGGTLSEEAELTIPVLSLSYDKGVELSQNNNSLVSLDVKTEVKTNTTWNVLAETPGGKADNVVMLGSHLDSVPAGPGMNDNGSGSAGILDVALRVMKNLDKDSTDYNKLRFAWWSAEEVGLIGSSRYVDGLTADEKSNIALYLNFDMIASQNYMLGVFDGDGSSFGQVGPKGSDAIEKLFHMYFGLETEGSVAVELSGRSDYAPFAEAGIPVGGLFTGAEGEKSEEEAVQFGGIAGEAYDACYHQECDDLSNINRDALTKNVNAIGYAAMTFAFSTAEVNGNKFARSLSKMRSKNLVEFDRSGSVHCGEHEEKM